MSYVNAEITDVYIGVDPEGFDKGSWVILLKFRSESCECEGRIRLTKTSVHDVGGEEYIENLCSMDRMVSLMKSCGVNSIDKLLGSFVRIDARENHGIGVRPILYGAYSYIELVSISHI